MNRMLSHLAALACALLFGAQAYAQGTVQQVGPVTPGDAVVWSRNGQVSDGGATAVASTGSYNWTGKQTFGPSTTTSSAINIVPGAAPILPINGDIWATSTGFYAAINNVAINLATPNLAASGPGGVSGILPVASGGSGTASASANTIFAAPNGSAGTPTFRALATPDFPDLASATALAGGGTTNRAMSAHFSDVIYARDRGVKCDGTTDDTAAINTMFAGVTANSAVLFPAGTCLFSANILIPGGINAITIMGSGYYSTVLKYTGTSTTIDLITFGTPGSGSTSSSNINTDIVMTSLRITSATAMTAGAALHIWHVARAVVDPVIDGQDGNGNLYNGLWCDECDIVSVPYVDISANNWGVLDNGSKTSESWYPNYVGELHLGKGKLGPSNGKTMQAGIHMAGGVGGLTCDATDIIGSVNNLLVDNAVSGTGNQGAYFGPTCFFDSSTGDNILINDTQSSAGPGGDREFVFYGPIATCAYSGTTGNCLNIQSWPNGIINLSGHIAAAGNDGIKYQDATATLAISGPTYIDSNKNYGIESTVSSPKITFVQPVFYTNTVGDFSANVLGSTLPIYSKQYPCTVGFQFGGASTGMTYTVQKCAYALRGFFVDMTYNLGLSAVGSSTGTATISGLPVAGTTARDAGGSGPAYQGNFATTVTSPILVHVGAGNSSADLYAILGGSQAALNNSHFTASTLFEGTLSYLRSGAN